MDGLGRGGGERGEVGEEGLVAGWFISYKTPEAVTTLKEQENVCIALMQKIPWLCMENQQRQHND